MLSEQLKQILDWFGKAVRSVVGGAVPKSVPRPLDSNLGSQVTEAGQCFSTEQHTDSIVLIRGKKITPETCFKT